MRAKVTWAWALVLCLFVTSASLGGAQTSETRELNITSTTFRDVAKKAAPAVVNVKIKSGIEFKKHSGKVVIPPEMGLSDELRERLEELFEQQAPNLTPEEREKLKYTASGSGVVIRSDGYIVTSNHVISGSKAEDIEVSFPDGRKMGKVKVVGADPMTDVAVIKVDAQGLSAVGWGDSEKMQVGDWVLAIGNPLEFSNTVSEGIISAKHRVIGKAVIEDLIQTTAMINPGNSGGALVNLDGELIGINMAIASSTGMWSGLGFAVPSATARTIVEQIISSGKVARGYLGIEMTPLTGNLAQYLGYDKEYGVVIGSVRPGSAAEKAGLQRYDIIARADGQEIKDMLDLNRIVGSKRAGATVDLEVYRQENQKLVPKNVKVTLGERPSEEELAKSLRQAKPEGGEQQASLGIRVVPSPSGKGVVVDQVLPNSRADRAGIEKGDVIMQVNRQDVNSAEDLAKALQSQKGSQMFYIERQGERLILVISGD